MSYQAKFEVNGLGLHVKINVIGSSLRIQQQTAAYL